MKYLQKLPISLKALFAFVFFSAISIVSSVSVGAQSLDGGIKGGVSAARGEGVPAVFLGDGGLVTTIINIMLFVVGFLSVVMLIWGGIRYILSGGNSASVTAAKNTILYAIVGLIIAFFAYAIINFVLTSISSFGGGGGTNV